MVLEIFKGLEYLYYYIYVLILYKYIKSINIFLDDDFYVRIVFFGVVKIRGELGVLEVIFKIVIEEGEIVEVKLGNCGI